MRPIVPVYPTVVLSKYLACALLLVVVGCRPSDGLGQRFMVGGIGLAGAGASGASASSAASDDADTIGIDPDALPEGAAHRLGSRRFVSHHGVGFAADGSIVTTTFEADAVTFFRNGRMRVLAKDSNAQVARGEHVPVAGGNIRVLALDGTVVSAFDPDGCNPYFAVFSLDGRTMVCDDSGVGVWDVDSGTLHFRLESEGINTLSGSMAASGSVLVFSTSYGDIEVYDLESGAGSTLTNGEFPDAIAISHDGDTLYVVVNGRVEARETRTGRVQWEARPDEGAEFSFPMTASLDGAMLAVQVRAGDTKGIAIIDARTQRTRMLDRVEATSLAFSADGSELASVTMGGVSVFDLESGARVLGPERVYAPVIRAHAHGDHVATISEHGVATVWDSGAGARIFERVVPGGWEPRAFSDVSFVSDESIAVLHRSRGVMVLDAATGERRCTAAASGRSLFALPDGRSFAVFEDHGPIRILGVDCTVRKEFPKRVAVLGVQLVDGGVRVWVSRSDDELKARRYWAEDIAMETWTKHKVPKSRGKTLWVPGKEWGELGEPNDDRRFEKLTAKGARRFTLSGLQGLMITPSGTTAVVVYSPVVSDDRRVGKVIELETGAVRKTFSIPERVDLDLAKATISLDSRWLTLVEDSSVLLYDLADVRPPLSPRSPA